jgi:branched-chain amino acid transport system ATP-binding protein
MHLLARANTPVGALTLIERKRLEMARAFATNPHLLLLDEIAGGLTEGECQELIETVKQVHALRNYHHLDRAHCARSARWRS